MGTTGNQSEILKKIEEQAIDCQKQVAYVKELLIEEWNMKLQISKEGIKEVEILKEALNQKQQ